MMTAPCHARQFVVDAFGQQRAICEPAQRIVESQETTVGLSFAESSDVGDYGDEQRHRIADIDAPFPRDDCANLARKIRMLFLVLVLLGPS